ncbi:MAG: hypothetical protein N4A76_14915 [Firmicutes bacterium]|jgi:hypothetical protein|nr:hypothetical protein [Bacillota bacterium]
MNKVLISPRADQKILNFFKNKGYEICHFKEMNHVYSSITDHLDTFMIKIDDTYVIDPGFYKINKDLIDGLALSYVLGDENVSSTYPGTVRYNCLVGEDYLIHNLKYTDEKIKELSSSKKIINVKQGYCNCSICKVADDGFITADKGISKALRSNGFDVLLIEEGYISLRDQEYGFIGGASSTLKDGSILFLGDIRNHPSFDEIHEFLERKGVSYSFIQDFEMIDLGGFLTI